MNRFLLLAAGLLLLASAHWIIAAPGLKDKEDKTDLKKLQGEWTIESWEQLGRQNNTQGSWTFDGEKYSLDQAGNLETGTIKLDPGKKPAFIDLTITGGNCSGNDQPGIYKLDGDTLVLCFAWPGATNRPTEFKSTAEGRSILITLKRVKK